MYDKDSATSPDCHIRTERSPAVDTVESGPAQSAIEIPHLSKSNSASY